MDRFISRALPQWFGPLPKCEVVRTGSTVSEWMFPTTILPYFFDVLASRQWRIPLALTKVGTVGVAIQRLGFAEKSLTAAELQLERPETLCNLIVGTQHTACSEQHHRVELSDTKSLHNKIADAPTTDKLDELVDEPADEPADEVVLRELEHFSRPVITQFVVGEADLAKIKDVDPLLGNAVDFCAELLKKRDATYAYNWLTSTQMEEHVQTCKKLCDEAEVLMQDSLRSLKLICEGIQCNCKTPKFSQGFADCLASWSSEWLNQGHRDAAHNAMRCLAANYLLLDDPCGICYSTEDEDTNNVHAEAISFVHTLRSVRDHMNV
eukprot:TRINITY_DN5786_c0_g1_i1.p1 TRINITY_DN5786_c0_g1~~TRINITY_DN5786_c0_g1_i1.p1  ORF type:complete len:375 (+),score=82.40 TRINITY_DN5786_c0_g1_i1:159-1127(+)